MKKTLVSALTTALVVGAASTTFAATNPFSDVPADHWAYDAVSQLAADGVIEGYGDDTFKGDKNITRYEMAQMVAKAMAKTNVSGNDKAILDKLAAEFSDELNNLGVRVANLEKNADKVKWNGTAEYTISRHRVEGRANDDVDNVNNVLFRLEPSAEVNSNWHVNARLDANSDLANDTGYEAGSKRGDENNGNVKLKRIYAQGDYTNFGVKVGKFAPIDDDSFADTTFSGAEVSFGNQLKATVAAGRISDEDNELTNDTADYQYYGLDYNFGKLYTGARFHHLDGAGNITGKHGNYAKTATEQADIWALKGAYTFDSNFGLNGFYSQNHDADYAEKAGSVELTYKGADQENAGTWGAWVAYRHLGQNAMVASTYDAVGLGEKAWEIGANYAPFKNVVAQVRYADGKQILGNSDVSKVFGRVNFYF